MATRAFYASYSFSPNASNNRLKHIYVSVIMINRTESFVKRWRKKEMDARQKTERPSKMPEEKS